MEAPASDTDHSAETALVAESRRDTDKAAGRAALAQDPSTVDSRRRAAALFFMSLESSENVGMKALDRAHESRVRNQAIVRPTVEVFDR